MRVTQNKQIATSKETMKDRQPEEKFSCAKKKSPYSNQNSKIIGLYFSFLNNKKISLLSFRYDVKYVFSH